MTTKPRLQKILQVILHKKMKQTKLREDRNHQTTGEEKTRNQSSTDSTAHNQTFKQQKQINGRNHHIPINNNTEC
jgi:hypothetical protein